MECIPKNSWKGEKWAKNARKLLYCFSRLPEPIRMFVSTQGVFIQHNMVLLVIDNITISRQTPFNWFQNFISPEVLRILHLHFLGAGSLKIFQIRYVLYVKFTIQMRGKFQACNVSHVGHLKVLLWHLSDVTITVINLIYMFGHMFV